MNPNHQSKLVIRLLSETAMGSGRGTEGEVDTEVTLDKDGLPFISGRAIKGLLRDSWNQMSPAFKDSDSRIAERLFGVGQSLSKNGSLAIGDAHLGDEIRMRLRWARKRKRKPNSSPPPLPRRFLLDLLTRIRTQTARDRTKGGVPSAGSLRTIRVLRKDLLFETQIDLLDDDSKRILALVCLGVRSMGMSRTRGLGKVSFYIGSRDNTLRLAELSKQ